MDKFTEEESQKIAKALLGKMPVHVRLLAEPHLKKFVQDAYELGFHIGADDRKTAIENLQRRMQR